MSLPAIGIRIGKGGGSSAPDIGYVEYGEAVLPSGFLKSGNKFVKKGNVFLK